MAQGMIDMMIAKNEGLDHVAPRTPEGTTPPPSGNGARDPSSRPRSAMWPAQGRSADSDVERDEQTYLERGQDANIEGRWAASAT
jgi:hypothetical protein